MDKKKTGASASGNHEEKKERNLFRKTAQSIRDKVRGLAKEKKSKQTTNSDSTTKTSTEIPRPSGRDNSDDSSTENDLPKSNTASSTARTTQSTSRTSATTEKKTDAPTNDSVRHTIDKSADQIKETATKDHIHINFHGVSTVDDLFQRIDSAVEKAKIVLEEGSEPVHVRIDTKPSNVPTPSVADLEKRSIEKSKIDSQDQNDEPIRIDYNEIHKLEDLLLKVENQPGHRQVILENAPQTPETSNAPKQDNPFFGPSSQTPNPTAANDSDDAPPKSILKTSQDPSSLNTLTKIASFQDNKIHVNIETIQDVDDQSDESTSKPHFSIESQAQEKEEDISPQAKDLIHIKKQLAPSASLPNKKREAPKAPQSVTAEDSSNATTPSTTVLTAKSADKIVKHPDNESGDWI